MTPIAVERLGFGWRSHLSALWWYGLLYRNPCRFHETLAALPRLRVLLAGCKLLLHAIPWAFLICVVCHLCLYGLLGMRSAFDDPEQLAPIWIPLHSIASKFAIGLGVGIVIGIADGIRRGIVAGTIAGIVFGIAFGITSGIVRQIGLEIGEGTALGIGEGIAPGAVAGIALGIAGGIAFGFSTATFLGVAIGIVFGFLNAIVFEIVSGVTSGSALAIAALITCHRAYYFPFHILFVWPRINGRRYPWHPVAWDSMCSLPFPRLENLLVAFNEQFPRAGQTELRRLIDDYPSQRMSALKAIATLTARQCSREETLANLPVLASELPEGETGFLRETGRVREMIAEIAGLQARLDATTQPYIRESLARALRTEIEAFVGRVAGFREPLSTEYSAAARQWLVIADRRLQDEKSATMKAVTPQVFRAGDPVDRDREAFVANVTVFGEFERQIVLSTGCPGIILYGRRRMGKSTVLRNIAAFLPAGIRVVTESLQNPRAFESMDAFAGQIISGVSLRCSDLPLPPDAPAGLPGLFGWLSELNSALDSSDKRLLLALDEYEQIDLKIGEGVFSEDLLAMLRESVQAHRRITWVLAGSHDITELTHAPWPSYLASLRMIEVPPFTLEETRLLLTEPLRYSSLWKPDDPNRPNFDAAFWGVGGIERIHVETRGWPHLVQLVAETAIDLVNQSAVEHVTAELMAQALDKAIVRGDAVLRMLLQTESGLPHEWEYLQGFRRRDTQLPPDDEAIYTSLRRRLLVKEEGSEWRLRVPLMNRWLRQRG